MNTSKEQIKRDIQFLQAELKPFGLDNAERLAQMLRDENSDDPAYPSGAYIRLMLNSKSNITPSTRFSDRFYRLKAWVEQELSTGGTKLLCLKDQIVIPDTYNPETKVKFVTLPDRLKLDEVTIVENEAGLNDALVYVPHEWIGQCSADGCGQLYLKRSASSKYHSAKCRRSEANRRRREARR